MSTSSTTFWQAEITAVERVHGHGGATEVLYVTTTDVGRQRSGAVPSVLSVVSSTVTGLPARRTSVGEAIQPVCFRWTSSTKSSSSC